MHAFMHFYAIYATQGAHEHKLCCDVYPGKVEIIVPQFTYIFDIYMYVFCRTF